MTPSILDNFHSNESIFDLINRRALETPDAVYLIDPDTGNETTYKELKSQAQSIASMIAAEGVSKGESVAFAMTNSPQTAVTILGIFYGGYLATAINLVAGNDVIAYVLEHSESKLILANEKGAEVVGAALKTSSLNLPMALVETLHDYDVQPNPAPSPSKEADGLLMYTSGTTGRPKGVVLTHENLLAGAGNTALAHELVSSDRGLCVLPLYHINGLCVTVLGALVSGGSLVMPTRFSVSTFWMMICTYQCSWFSVVPTQISYLLHDEASAPLAHELKHVRFGRSASSPLSPDVHKAFEKRFAMPMIETMGLTETAAQILSNPLPPGTRKIGSPGLAYGNQIRIADNNQNEVPRGTEGEALVLGSNVMRCYLKNDAATSQAITKDGWLRTGDLGRMDEDGYVYITGRLKELIIKGGENIAPREIDEALYSHPDIVEAAAFSKKCSRYGETVEAAVMVCEGSNLVEAELLDLCRKKIGPFKTPDRIHFLAELPKGPSGKIQRIKLGSIL